MSIGKVRKHRRSFEFSWLGGFKIIILMSMIALLGAVIFIATNASYFPIRTVKIFGAQHVEHTAVQKLVSPLVSQGFFSVDIDKVKERVLQLPWTSQVVVRRIWPDLITVVINEKKPIAQWNAGSLLSSSGELFTPDVTTIPQGLPQLVGPSGEQLFMAEYYAKMNSILSSLHSKITRLELTPAMAWSLTLDNGVKLTVGQKDILTRLNHFVKVYAKIVGDRASDVEYVDLRYPNGMAVKWKTVT